MTREIAIGARLSQIAAQRPDDVALTLVGLAGSPDVTLTWGEVDAVSSRLARALAKLGVGSDSFVGVALPNSIDHYVASFATWKLGACVMPLRPNVPERERLALLGVLTPTVMIGTWSEATCPVLDAKAMYAAAAAETDASPLPEVVPQPGRATTSGGTTGVPKLIIDTRPWAAAPGDYANPKTRTIGIAYGQRQLVVGSLYHTIGFFFSNKGLTEEHTLFIMPKFDAGEVLQAIERYKIQYTVVTPIHMQRMSRHPLVNTVDLSSLQGMLHTGAQCPPALKRFWIDRIGPTQLFESYGSTESVGGVTNRGDDWLTHPGTVGKPGPAFSIKIIGEDGSVLPTGQVGEIFFYPKDPSPTFSYLGGHEIKRAGDGGVSIGDLGYLDDDGFVYIVDRRTDMIISGGVNVFASEVEAALLEHPGVHDAVVIGLPDPEWGRRVHAIVVSQPGVPKPTDAELIEFCRERIAAPKLPKSVEWLPELPRDELGKIRRPALLAERIPEENAS